MFAIEGIEYKAIIRDMIFFFFISSKNSFAIFVNNNCIFCNIAIIITAKIKRNITVVYHNIKSVVTLKCVFANSMYSFG